MLPRGSPLTQRDPDSSIHSPALPACVLLAHWHIPSTNEKWAAFSGTAGEAGCQGRPRGDPAIAEPNQPCAARASLVVSAGPCGCLSTHSQEGPGGELGCGLAGDYLLCCCCCCCCLLQHLPRQDDFQPPSCSAFLHVPLVIAAANSGAHVLGTREDPSHCPLLPAFSMSPCFTVHSRAIKFHLMQPLGSLQHHCHMMFTLPWDSAAPGSRMVSWCYPRVTLLESVLAQGLQRPHRTVSAAAEPGVGSRASWRDAQCRAGSATFPGELPEFPSAVLCVDKPARTSSSFVAL